MMSFTFLGNSAIYFIFFWNVFQHIMSVMTNIIQHTLVGFIGIA